MSAPHRITNHWYAESEFQRRRHGRNHNVRPRAQKASRRGEARRAPDAKSSRRHRQRETTQVERLALVFFSLFIVCHSRFVRAAPGAPASWISARREPYPYFATSDAAPKDFCAPDATRGRPRRALGASDAPPIARASRVAREGVVKPRARGRRDVDARDVVPVRPRSSARGRRDGGRR